MLRTYYYVFADAFYVNRFSESVSELTKSNLSNQMIEYYCELRK